MRISLLLFSFATCLGFEPDVVVPGDVMLGGLLSIQTYGTARCNQLNPESVQIYQAVRWFIQKLNDRNYLQNVKIGLHAFNTCDEPEYAVEATLNMLQVHKNKNLYGVLGPERSSEVQIVSRLLSSLPEESRIPLLSYSATAATLSDKSVYKNLIRVIASDSLQVEVLHQLVLTLQWNYIAIVYEEDTYGIDGARALRSLLEQSDVCIPVYFGITTDASTEDRRKSFISLADELEKQPNRASPVAGLVFIGRGTTANLMFNYLSINLQTFQVIASEALSVNTDYLKDNNGTIYPKAKGILTVSPPVYEPIEFRRYWQSLHNNQSQLLLESKDNPWLLKYLEYVSGCSLDSATDVSPSCISRASAAEAFEMSLYTSYALVSVATFAKALKELYVAACPVQNGVCDAMKKSDIIQKFETVTVSQLEFKELANFNRSFSFVKGEIDFIEKDETSPTYSVYNYQSCSSKFCLEKVGDHIKGELMLTKSNIKSYDKSGVETSGPVEAQCKPTFSCESCQSVGSQGKVYHIPGDFYVVGLAPMHDQGTGLSDCGSLRSSAGVGVDIAEAIAYSIHRINQKKDKFIGLLGNKKIGLIVIDTCNNYLVARERVIQLERGDLQLNCNSSNIIGYIGPYGSSVSVPISLVMEELKKVVISYASTSISLSSRSIHPNFMRTCAPDDKQADVIMHLANELKATHVQIIYSDEEYGRAGVAALKTSGKEYEICIAQSIAVPDQPTDSDFNNVVSRLGNFTRAKVVIIFVRSYITPLLVGFLNIKWKNSGEVVFIGGENWGKRSSILGNNYITLGSLTLAQELPKNQGYENYVGDIDVLKTKNPWFGDYMEKKGECYFPMSFNKTSNRECTPSLLAQAQTSDPWVPFAINAVYSFVLGFNSTLSAQCPGSVSICPEYNTAALIARVKEVRLDIYSDGGNVRVFDDNGEGNVGYTISQVVRDGGNLVYNKVGDSTDKAVRFSMDDLVTNAQFQSECLTPKECEACKLQIGEISGPVSTTDDTTTAVILLGVVVALLLVVNVVLVVLGVRHLRKNSSRDSGSGDKTDTVMFSNDSYSRDIAAAGAQGVPNNGYLTAVHDTHLNSGETSANSRGRLPSHQPNNDTNLRFENSPRSSTYAFTEHLD